MAIDACDISKVKHLLAQKENPNDFGSTIFAPVHAAAAVGAMQALALMLDHSADIELRDKHTQGETPLFYAVDWSRIDVVRYLLKQGANANATTLHGYSVLHKAAGHQEAKEEIVKLLVNAGANVNAATPGGTTVLMSAVNATKPSIAVYLLGKGADPNRQDADGATALHLAAYESDTRIIDALLEHGADPSIKDENGRLPEAIAAENKRYATARLLAQNRTKKAPN